MTDLAHVTGPVAALAAGVVTSLHCVGMCGPLSCALCVKQGGRGSLAATAAYHAMRLVSYALLGAIAGWLGERVGGWLTGGAVKGLAWAFAVFFLVIAFGWDRRLRIGPGAWASAPLAFVARFGAVPRGLTLGFFTPLIPCAPLYLIAAAAALSGSAVAGAGILSAFALGTVPAMALLQGSYLRFGSAMSPAAMDWTRRGLAFAGAVLLGWRALAEVCPMCCL